MEVLGVERYITCYWEGNFLKRIPISEELYQDWLASADLYQRWLEQLMNEAVAAEIDNGLSEIAS